MSEAFHLYVISFTVGAESGLAMVAAQDEKSAFQILKNGGSRHCDGYSLIQTRDIGMTANCHYGLLLESYVNALQAFEAITSVANYMIGPEGKEGKPGEKGDQGPSPFDTVNFTVDNTSGIPSAVSRIVTNGGSKVLKVDVFGLKGKEGVSISDVTQNVIAGQDGSNNEITITLSDGRSSKIYIKNGSTGVNAVNAYVDSSSGSPSVIREFEDGTLSLWFSGLKGTPGRPGISNTTMKVLDDIEEMPDASEATASIIFFVYNDETEVYDRYFTQFDGTNYSYFQAGSATIDLSDYERKDANVWLTREEFDALDVKDVTKTYNIYEEEYE